MALHSKASVRGSSLDDIYAAPEMEENAAGNRTTIPRPANLQYGYTGKYDAWNRLVSLYDGNAYVQVNQYDGLHRRIVRDETGGNGDKRHFYYNENWQCLAETVESGGSETADALYAYHPHYIDAVACRLGPGGDDDAIYYLHDANFNVVGVIDAGQSSKPVVERYAYSPYGEVTVLNADFGRDIDETGGDGKSDIGNEFLYTGRRLDPETGLQYSRYRYYGAELGRFLTRDPIGYLGGKDLYAYVGGMPTGYVDPLGTYEIVGDGPFDIQRCYADCERTYAQPRYQEVCKKGCRDKLRKHQKWKKRCDLMEKQVLAALSAECSRSAADYDLCIKEAARITSTLGETCRSNWKEEVGYGIRRSEKAMGYWCYEWAYGYQDAVNELKPEYFAVEIDHASTTGQSLLGYGYKVHYWIELYVNNDLVIYVDDGFWDGAMVHKEMPCGGEYVYPPTAGEPRRACDPVKPYPPVSK